MAENIQNASSDGQPPDEIKTQGKRNRQIRSTKSSDKGKYKPEYGKSWAVIIGINNYTQVNKLDYAVKDAVGLAELLVAKLGFPKAQILAVLDPPPEQLNPPYYLFSEHATKAKIEELLVTFLPEKLDVDDRLLIFYAGHGESRQLPDGEEEGYLVPVDGQQGAWHTLIQINNVINTRNYYKAKHVFYLFDACYSGLATVRSTVTRRNFEKEMLTYRARQVLTAGNAKQVVADKGPDGHSIFTGFVLQGLGGDAAYKKSDVITASDLMVYVKNKVMRYAGSLQTPDYGKLLGHESGGDFVFKLPTPSGILTAKEQVELAIHLYELGHRLGDRGRFESAIHHLNAALNAPSLSPTEAMQAKYWLNKARISAGNLDGAIREFKLLMEDKEAPVDTLFYLGFAQAKKKQFKAALQTFERLLKRYPEADYSGWVKSYIDWLRQPSVGKKYALLIGIDKYSREVDTGSVNDVKLLEKTFIDFLGFENIYTLTDEKASRTNILSKLQYIMDVTKREDTVIVHYSGLGRQDSQYVLLTQIIQIGGKPIYDGIRSEELHHIMNRIRAEKKILIIDSIINEELLDLARTDANYAVIAAASPDSQSYSVPFDFEGEEQKQGLLSSTLVQLVHQEKPYELTFGRLRDTLKNKIIEYKLKKTIEQTQKPILVAKLEQSIFAPEDNLLVFCDFALRRNYSDLTIEQIQTLYSKAKSKIPVPFAQMYYSFGCAFLDKKNYPEAEEALHTAIIHRNGDYPEAILTLAKLQFFRDQYDQAATNFKQIARIKHSTDLREHLEQLVAQLQRLNGHPKQTHALLVGIDRYRLPDAPPVRGAVNDVQALREILVKKLGFHKSNITVLLNEKARYVTILEEFKKLVEKSRQEPALFYFAGYGSEEQGEPTIVSIDSRQGFIYDITLAELVRLTNDSSSQLITIVDAGFAVSTENVESSRMLTPDTRMRMPTRHLRPDPTWNRNEKELNIQIGCISIYPGSIRWRDLPPESQNMSLEAELPGLTSQNRTAWHGRLTHALIETLHQTAPSTLTYKGLIETIKTRLAAFPAVVPYMFGKEQQINSVFFNNWLQRAQIEQLITSVEDYPIHQVADVLDRVITGYETVDEYYPEACLNAGIAYALLGDYDKSILYLENANRFYTDKTIPEEAQVINPRTDKLYREVKYYLGKVLYESEQNLEEAISHLRQVVNLSPDNGYAQYYLGKALRTQLERGIVPEAINAFESYIAQGAPLGEEDEIRAFLTVQQKPESNQQ